MKKEDFCVKKYIHELPKEKCRSCKYKKELGYTHHISCNKKSLVFSASYHGVANGWFIFPFNFDPIWLNNCTGYRPKEEKFEDYSKEELFEIIMFQKNLFLHLMRNDNLIIGFDPDKAVELFKTFSQIAHKDKVKKLEDVADIEHTILVKLAEEFCSL